MPPYMTEPVTTDPYDRFMVEAFSDLDTIALSTGFLSFFGRPSGRTTFSPTASVVDIDIRRGNKKISALIPRGGVTQYLDNLDTEATRYTTFSRVFPLSLEAGNIESRQLDRRAFGESPYSEGDRLMRARALAFEHHEEQVRRQVGMWELLAAQAIRTGKQDAIIGTSDADLQYNFHRKATHTFTAAASWATAGTDIEGDIITACNLIREDAHLMPDFAICGTTAISGIMSNTALLARGDNRRVHLFEVGSVGGTPPVPPQLQFLTDGGMIYRGIVETSEGYIVHLFTYLDTYTTNAGVATRYLDADHCIIGSSAARCDRYFGPPERLPLSPAEQDEMRWLMGFDQNAQIMPAKAAAKGQVIPARAFYFDAYKSGRHTLTVETQTAPIFAPVNTDAFVLIDVTP